MLANQQQEKVRTLRGSCISFRRRIKELTSELESIEAQANEYDKQRALGDGVLGYILPSHLTKFVDALYDDDDGRFIGLRCSCGGRCGERHSDGLWIWTHPNRICPLVELKRQWDAQPKPAATTDGYG
jgi:hypothetical protein